MIFNSSYHCIALEFTYKLGLYKMHLIESAKIIPLTTLVSNHWRKRHSSTYYWLRLQHRQWHQQHVTESAVGVTMNSSWRQDVALSTCTECYARILYMRVQNSGITYSHLQSDVVNVNISMIQWHLHLQCHVTTAGNQNCPNVMLAQKGEGGLM